MGNEYNQLGRYLEKNELDIATFLTIASEICKKVHDLHIQHARCNNLTPKKIFINTHKQVKISDIDVNDENINKVYRAPEQMVKDSKQINESSDIYVLGIIFYEMLLGELPFKYIELLTFSHTVMTQKVPFVSDKNKRIPYLISLIIEKMTSINQSERYHNILSTSIDLTKALHTLNDESEINLFKIDNFNTILGLHTSDIIYGRDQEEKKLQYIIDSKTDKSNKVVLVYGHSGIGKSSLIKKVVAKNRDQFSHTITFKLEYGEQSTPYQVLYTALRDKTKQIIAQDEESLLYYKNKLLHILGTYAQLLIDVIPEIETIIGKQSLIPTDTKVNLDNLLVRFMELFLDIEKPLCIYIDDIQWADKVTIDWIK